MAEMGHDHLTAMHHSVLMYTVVHLLASTAHVHQTRVLKDRQMMGDRRLGDRKRLRDVSHAHFVLTEKPQYLLTRAVRHSFAEHHTLGH